MNKLLEICVDCWESAKNAELGGAQRIELCAALSEDGLTPSLGFAHRCVQELNLEVFPMIRPRSGHFVYSKDEIQIMIEDIHRFKSVGVHGIVTGILTQDNQIDEIAMRRLINATRPLPLTFHRAFDTIPDPVAGLNILIDLKVDRLLTSGQQDSAMAGIELLKELVKVAKDRIRIMPGAGINSQNITHILETGAYEYHGSAKASNNTITDIEEVRKIVELLQA